MPTMLNRLLHITMFLVLAATAGAQYLPGKLQGGSGVPGTQSRSPLNSLERAANNLPGITIVTDTFGNQRWSYYVRVLDTCVNYNPLLTVGNLPISSFVYQCGDNDSLFYIDWKSDVVLISVGGGPSCDADWLDIVTNDCPDNINDSIYTQKYAAIGARLVWPTAELLVSDSAAVQVTVLSGNRNSRLGFWDNVNEFGSTIDQSGAQTLWYIEPTGEMRWATAGSGTVQAPGAPFVNQFAINPADAPLPTVQAHLYPNTRSDTNTVENFLYTDLLGKFRSQPIDSLVQIVVDSIQADTTLQRNWYTHNGVTTDLGRVAFVKRSAWWRGLDSLGFLRFTMRPDLFDGPQFTIWQDSIDIDADTIAWRSTYHPALQFQNFEADATYSHYDSLKVAAWGQFSAFPSLNFDGTEKGFFYDPSNEGVVLLNGDGITGNYSTLIMDQEYLISNIFANGGIANLYFDQTGFSTYSDYNNDGANLTELTAATNNTSSIGRFSFTLDVSLYGSASFDVQKDANNDIIGFYQREKDENWNTSVYMGMAQSNNPLYVGSNRAFGVRTSEDLTLSIPFDWLQVYLPNDTTENALSFYNRAYYWRNEHPTGAAGDTLLHFWAATGPGGEAGSDPGFMTLDDIRGGASNWYNSNGATTDNTRIATVTETATWLSNDVTADGVYPFRFELAGGSPNEPENMVWVFPAGDSATLSQSDQELIFFSSNQWLFKSDETTTIQADSFQYNPNLGGTAFRVGDNNVITQNAPSGTPTHRDAIEYRTITGTAQTELFLDGSADIWVLPTNSVQSFKIHVAAICSSAGNGVGISTGDAYTGWFLGGIKRVTNTTSLVGSVQADATAQSDAGMSTSVVTIDADDTDESLRIRFTPPNTAGTTTVIQVIATIEIAQTSY